MAAFTSGRTARRAGEGVKIPLGLWEGSTENAAVATALLSDLIDRGLDPEIGVDLVAGGDGGPGEGGPPCRRKVRGSR